MPRLDRRHFLIGMGAGGAGLALPRLAFAQLPTEKRFVLIILRGAMDGLAAVPPIGDGDYRDLRGDLTVDERHGARPLGTGGFALHPALATLADWYEEGTAAVLHAIASPYRDRSHFEGQDLLEFGTAQAGAARDGWLNRALAAMESDNRRLGIALGHTMPLVLRGDVPVASWAPSALAGGGPDFLARLESMYQTDAELAPVMDQAMDSLAMADRVLDGQSMQPGRGRQAAVRLAEAAGAFLAAPDGPRIAVLDAGGWDTHTGQGTANGALARALGTLDQALAGLRGTLGPAWQQTMVAVVTEFGRTVRPNGSGGTDHGTATAALLAGGAVRGGQMVADWPGLAPTHLHEGRDLAPTLDLRAVFKTALTGHLGLAREAVDRLVFPDGQQVPMVDGLTR